MMPKPTIDLTKKYNEQRINSGWGRIVPCWLQKVEAVAAFRDERVAARWKWKLWLQSTNVHRNKSKQTRTNLESKQTLGILSKRLKQIIKSDPTRFSNSYKPSIYSLDIRVKVPLTMRCQWHANDVEMTLVEWHKLLCWCGR